jgi:hypothetical protein
MSEQHTRRQWTEAEARGAISSLVSAAYGKAESFPMHIPGKPSDADVLLHDCIDELEYYRARQQAKETTHALLARMARFYDDRAKAAHRLMNESSDLEVAARHAATALSWQQRWHVILQVAQNLDSPLSGLPEVASLPPVTFSQERFSDTGAHEIARLREPHVPSNQTRQWRVEALYDGRTQIAVIYDGPDYGVMCQCVGSLCLEVTVDKVFVWRDGEKYRHIEVR